MKATFTNTTYELQAAAERAGLLVCSMTSGKDSKEICIIKNHAIGSTHAVMCLIGALADDGQDTLINVEG